MQFKYKLWIALLTVLVVVLSAALITHLVLSNKDQKMDQGNLVSSNQMGRGMLVRQLNFDNQQEQKFDSLRQNFFKNTLSLRDSLNSINSQIANALSESRPNREEINLLVEQACRLENRYKKLLVLHVLELQQICNPEQREVLNTLYPQLIGSSQERGRGMRHRNRWGWQQRFQ
ncbi:MAG: Heavy-metal resistance [Bacteroidales bacterium]|jgi:Spy/CpxP family protein refolding chaperone|nr:Heavy-metal resistance [Bacteroidales bacterium]MDN5328408.1 Heavy-metal resistance [Bacteroidales bacterium]